MNKFAPYELQFDDAGRKQLIAESLILLRKSHNYTQKQVAEFLGIHPVTYNGYEKAKNEPSAETIVRLSYLYQVPTDLILQVKTLDFNHSVDMMNWIEFYQGKLEDYKQESLIERDTAIMQMISTVDGFTEILKKMVEQQAAQDEQSSRETEKQQSNQNEKNGGGT
ncbi:MAG: helix-turn-helix transcriptional regulator [Eubacteriales bacterium]